MELKELKKQIPYQWRVQSFSKHKPAAQCVAYIDARDVMDLLDDVCGPQNWQSDFKDVGGQMFAGIGIRVGASGIEDAADWVWKWDTGSETAVEAEKGQASDSFKRAAVKWGIGRFLYDLPIKTVKANEAKKDGTFPYVVDDNGQRVWDLTKHLNGSQTAKTAPGAMKTAKAAPATSDAGVRLAAAADRLMKQLEILEAPRATKEERRSSIKELTGMEVVANDVHVLEQIGEKLEAIIEENNNN